MKREITFDLKEESHRNFAKWIVESYNGTFDGTYGVFDNHSGKGEVWYYGWKDLLEVAVIENVLYEETHFIRKATHENKWLLLVYNLSQSVNQEIKTDRNLLGKLSDGIFAHSLSYDSTYIYQAHQLNRAIILRIDKSAISRFTKNHKILSFFDKNNTFAFYEQLNAETFKKVIKIFSSQQDRDFSEGQTMNISIELILSFFQQIKERQLNSSIGRGLHPKDIQLMQMARKFLATSYYNKITLPELADKLNISVSKLKRDFKKYYNTNVTQFYTDIRMTKAFELLETGKHQVGDVAEIIGYESLPQFTQTFKKYHGILPNQVITKTTRNNSLSYIKQS
ncbi:helix-turn-helix transcriptional regulator [Halosquirtibacter xylanolyticus]|uniref:AraC family transcriptional regulator n=1 Tax=Halosquirtibacter xylanolyticus TaxID=3374599 RepID=UPI0037497F1E|nr:helix-turn-helix transcriptional regulator [Prolixibacteraceae bacterium]